MFRFSRRFITGSIVAFAVLVTASFVFGVSGASVRADNQRAITIHDGEESLTVTTKATTVGEVLERADINLSENDMVEPSPDTPLLSPAYTVNVYRARPVTIIDGTSRTQLMSPYQSARSIVDNADMELHEEDIVSKQRIDNFLSEGGPGLKVELDRAAKITLVLYGEQAEVRTQATTVGELLEEKGIMLGPKDGISKPEETPIREGMMLDVYRDGVQTETKELPVPFKTRIIQDANREVGYREIKEPGKKGKKVVTYQIELKNGKEVGRKVIQSVVTEQPKQQVEIVGAKPSFGGDFAEALAKLRSCEGSYDSWNPAGPYYGAYQFDQGTWAGAAPPGAEYGNATPAQQDQAARNLYERRGWQPWPVCGAELPDIYR